MYKQSADPEFNNRISILVKIVASVVAILVLPFTILIPIIVGLFSCNWMKKRKPVTWAKLFEQETPTTTNGENNDIL